MATTKTKAKTRSRKKNGMTIPVAVVAGFMPGLITTGQHWVWHGPLGAAREAGRVYLGVDFTTGSFTGFQTLWYGTFPALLGVLAHKIVGQKLGLNRVLARSGIPFIRF